MRAGRSSVEHIASLNVCSLRKSTRSDGDDDGLGFDAASLER